MRKTLQTFLTPCQINYTLHTTVTSILKCSLFPPTQKQKLNHLIFLFLYYFCHNNYSIIREDGGRGWVTLQSVSNPNSPDFLRCLIETRCPSTAGVFIYDISVLFQILSALQRSEPAGRHAAGSHSSLLGLIKTFFFSCLKKNRGQKKNFTLSKRTMTNNNAA